MGKPGGQAARDTQAQPDVRGGPPAPGRARHPAAPLPPNPEGRQSPPSNGPAWSGGHRAHPPTCPHLLPHPGLLAPEIRTPSEAPSWPGRVGTCPLYPPPPPPPGLERGEEAEGEPDAAASRAAPVPRAPTLPPCRVPPPPNTHGRETGPGTRGSSWHRQRSSQAWRQGSQPALPPAAPPARPACTPHARSRTTWPVRAAAGGPGGGVQGGDPRGQESRAGQLY